MKLLWQREVFCLFWKKSAGELRSGKYRRFARRPEEKSGFGENFNRHRKITIQKGVSR